MFKKKQQPAQPERRRPLATSQTPNAVFSYRALRSAHPEVVGRDAERPDEATIASRRKRRRSLLANAKLVGITLAIILFAILDLELSTTPKVVATGDGSGQIFLRSLTTYEAAARSLFASSALNRNKVTVDTAHITQSLLREFPELTAASVSLPFIGSQPVVYIQPASPKLILATQSSGNLIVDNDGRALIDAAQVSNLKNLHLPTVTDQSGLPLQVGQDVLTATDVAYITEVVGQLSAKGVTVSSLTLPVGTSELDVRMAGVSYFVKFNLAANDARQEAGTYLATRSYLASHNITPAAYVDVRVAERAYYK